MISRPSFRRSAPLAVAVLAGLLVGLAVMPYALAARQPDPVRAAWQRARAAGAYHFTSDVTQLTVPSATVMNVGRSGRTETYHLEGQNNVRDAKLEMRLWSDAGSVLVDKSGAGVRVENGKTFVRQGDGEWKAAENATDGIAPQGDFMAYLVAVKGVTADAPETRAGIAFTRYRFTLDGPTFASQVRDQLEQSMRQKGELPAEVRLSIPAYYRDMTGYGELWVRQDTGLPLRQILDLSFPPQGNEAVRTQITMTFSQFGQPAGAPSLPGVPVGVQPLVGSLLVVLAALGGLWLLLRFHRSRPVRNAIFLVVIGSLLGEPVLTSLRLSSFFGAQTARAAAQERQQQEAEQLGALRSGDISPAFDPHANPLVEQAEQAELATQFVRFLPAPHVGVPAATGAELPVSDDGTDTDQDGLTDYQEGRVGTAANNADTDNDGAPDGLEARGFEYPAGSGKMWYLNPLEADSNGDGLSDVLECWRNPPAPGTAPNAMPRCDLDTDGDATPDLFDTDNDNDGVLDRKDDSPFVAITGLTEANPLKLTLNGLAAGKSTAANFQLRPANEKQLSYALNVLDWPYDRAAQVQDVDGKTYADVAKALGRVPQANESNGDTKILPMLELRIPSAAANLPSSDELVSYGVTVGDYTADGSTKLVYVPLSVQADDKTGARVGFTGQMRYLPTGSWASPHEARLAWVVQVLSDIPCDHSDASAAAQGCASDNYFHNVPRPIQTYYTDWTLTGLAVHEDRGATIAVIYEDPAVDTNLKDDTALWALSTVLDHHFVIGRDENNDGQRDLTFAQLGPLFDRTRNSGVSDAARYGVPNSLRVAEVDKPTLEEAVATTAMTETKTVLTAFQTAATADRSAKPLLLFAQESQQRTLSLDGLRASGGYVVKTAAGLVMDMAPAGQTVQPVSITAGLKWTPYCAPASGPLTWEPCALDTYWAELEQRYGSLPNLPGEPTDPDLVHARLQLAQLYFTGLSAGYYGTVQQGTRIVSPNSTLDTAADTTTVLRNTLASQIGLATLTQVATLAFARTIGVPLAVRATGLVKDPTLFNLAKSLYSGIKDAQSGDLKGSATAVKTLTNKRIALGRTVLTPLAAAGAVLMVASQIVDLIPNVPQGAKTIVASVALGITVGLTVVLPIVEVSLQIKAGLTTVETALTSLSKIGRVAKIGNVVGLVLSVAVTSILFIYTAATSGLPVGSPELNNAFVGALAAAIYAFILFALSATLVGGIIVAIIAAIDALLTIICEAGVDEMRVLPGGECFTLGAAVVTAITYMLYNYDLMIHTDHKDASGNNDLVTVGGPKVAFATPSAGYVAGNDLTVSMPITSHVVHKSPDAAKGIYINFYLWLFSPENIRSSTVRYSLTRPNTADLNVDRNQMNGEWQNVVEDHKYVLTPMYHGTAKTTAQLAPITYEPGLNQSASFYLNQGLALPAYECFALPNIIPPFLPPFIPICYTRTFTNHSSTPIDSLKFDIFPTSLDGFMALTSTGDGGLRLGWDPTFQSLPDADGDGLLSSAQGGLDPNDATWDADNDGLSDANELQRRHDGAAFSPISCDTDGDGLTDHQEALLGTDPASADTDNDGRTDSQEVWHQVYNTSTCRPQLDQNSRPVWTGGWDVTIGGATALGVHVSSSPLKADTDDDSLDDLAEYELRDQTDNNGLPYSPLVVNTPPISIYTDASDLDRYVRPGQSLVYTTTVVANAALAPSVLDVMAPAALGGDRAPALLAFDPLTFTTAQTVTHEAPVTVASGLSTQSLSLTSSVRARLAPSGGAGWAFEPITAEPTLGGFTAPLSAFFTNLAASRPDRQDSYLLSALTTDSIVSGRGDIVAYALPGGQTRTLDNDNNNATFLRGYTPPRVAYNNQGKGLAVWDEYDNCRTLTINSLKVVTPGGDHGTSGIEPMLYGVDDEQDFDPLDGGYQRLWASTIFGLYDMGAGSTAGPDASGFPVTVSFCGDIRLEVYENDAGDNFSGNQRIGTGVLINQTVGSGIYTIDGTSSGNGEANGKIELGITVPYEDKYVVNGAFVGTDGAITQRIAFPYPTGFTSQGFVINRRPTVASNGDGFLVVYEMVTGPSPFSVTRYLALRAFDRDGNVVGSHINNLGTFSLGFSINELHSSIAWLGDRYRAAFKATGSSTIAVSDFTAQGADTGLRLQTVATDALSPSSGFGDIDAVTNDLAPNLAYDPATGRWLMTYVRSSGVSDPKTYGQAHVYPSVSSVTPLASRQVTEGVHQASPAYNPVTQGWQIGWSVHRFTGNTTESKVLVDALQSSNLSPLTSQATLLIHPPSSGAADLLPGNSLACPLSNSQPLIDLRFEELPGATTFADSSGYGNTATCTGAGCPAAGVAGAVDNQNRAVGTRASDYALGFDGVDDALTVNRGVTNDFTVAFWVKAAAGSNSNAILVDQGANVANGFTVWLGGGKPGFLIGTNQETSSPTGVDDGKWHFVAATRQRASGQVALYLDGNPTPVASNTFTTAALNAVSDIRIARDRSGARGFTGALDQLQIFPSALSGDTVQALYNRTLAAYCVAAKPSAPGSGVEWAKLRLTQQDTRGGKITASGALKLTVDSDAPTSILTAVANGAYVQGSSGTPTTLIIGGTASDPTSGVALVEVSANNGAWRAATGAATWTYPLQVTEGAYSLRTRATDNVGNVGTPSAAITVLADAQPPQVTLNTATAAVKPTRAPTGRWSVDLSGTASDPAIGAQPGSGVKTVEVRLRGQDDTTFGNGWQSATLKGNAWSITYAFPDGLVDPTGAYAVSVRATDNVGNPSADTASSGILRVDGTGPRGTVRQNDARRSVISDTLTINGAVSDAGASGVTALEIGFVPVEEAATQQQNSNPTWYATVLATPGAATSAWSFKVPTTLEGMYQVDLRGTDSLGNVAVTANVWRGVIDTRDPRLAMTATATGASYFDAASNTQMHEVRFVCAAVDRHLTEESFDCPGEGLQPPVRSFDNNPELQALFPDLTIRTGLAISYTLWVATTTPAATARACDSFGRCAQASTPAAAGGLSAVKGGSLVAATGQTAAPAPGAPQAVIVAPTNDSFVAADNSIRVTVAAEAGASLKEVTLNLDGTVVATLTFARADAATRTLRTVDVPIAAEGRHTLVARATDWANATQTTLFPATFTLDRQAPTLTIDARARTVADTWQPESGVLRFNGTASDSVGLTAVQIREGAHAFVDATFGNGVWRTALPVQDPEGRTLSVVVRAIDRAGRITEITQHIGTDLSAADAPDTAISSGPANPSGVNTASFVFSGTASAVAFDCQLDEGPYTPCASPLTYGDLSKGGHTFRVRAIDSRGFADLSPASATWTINAGRPDATITGRPTDPTTARTATFTFTGDATATSFECSLDGAAFVACTSPQSYSGLGSGGHVFQVRARDAAHQAGAADRALWTILNDVPVAAGQTVVVIPNIAKAITLSAADSDPLTFKIVTPPTHGVLLGTPPHVTFLPDTGFGGVDSFTFRVSDGLAESNLATITLYVDNTPPTVTCSVSPNSLWPPNHGLIEVRATVNVTDEHSGPAGFRLVSVTSNEPDSGLNREDLPNDIQGWTPGTADISGQVRAERSDTGTGRLYSLTYQGMDRAGNTATCRTSVTVPHN
jgi:hypothetical protein